MGLLEWIRSQLTRSRKSAPRKLRFVEGDELPEIMTKHELVVAREGKTMWTAGMLCPCGCGRRLELMLLAGVKPRWDLKIDRKGRPSLFPSVWVADGCRSHFWLRSGNVHWCVDSYTQP